VCGALSDRPAVPIRWRLAVAAGLAFILLCVLAFGLWPPAAARRIPTERARAPSVEIALAPPPGAASAEAMSDHAAAAARWAPLLDKARGGDPDAQHALAVALAEGRGGLPRDPERASEWFREAAINGVADAQYRLGLLYLERTSLESGRTGREAEGDDVAEALIWLQTAADRQHANAQYALARLYRDGRGVVARDPAESARWLRRAALLGHGAAARDLAAALLLDRSNASGGKAGTPAAADETEAYAWYDRAAAAGDDAAAAARDRLAARLPPERRAAAEARAAALAAQPDGAPARSLVMEIQRLLAEAGYDPGPVDGRLGDRTVEAIRRYQSDGSLVLDGRADDDLMARLKASVLPAPPAAN
jgi:hypothetical protein